MSRPRLLVAAAALALIPSLGIAQAAASGPRTYTVKTGDTLWDIAKAFFNDPFLWPEIYRVNTDVVEDPHWIYPGEILRIPDVAALQTRSPDEVAAVAPAAMQPSPMSPTPSTGRTRNIAFSPTATAPRTAVRAGEYLSAPFVGEVGGPSLAGKITHTSQGAEPGHSEPARANGEWLQLFDKVVIQPPSGVRAVKGDRFLAYRLGDVLHGHGQVVEPVGTVQIEDAGSGNDGKVIASVRAMFGPMRVGDGLIPLDTLVARKDVFPAAVVPTVNSNVLWVQGKPLLPSIGSYLIFGVSAADGLVTGDQITLVRERGSDGSGGNLPDEVLGVAQVHKVTQYGSSAIIIRVNNDGIGRGTIGRLTAKMP